MCTMTQIVTIVTIDRKIVKDCEFVCWGGGGKGERRWGQRERREERGEGGGKSGKERKGEIEGQGREMKECGEWGGRPVERTKVN